MINRRNLLQVAMALVAFALVAITMAACGSSSDGNSPAASASAGGFDVVRCKPIRPSTPCFPMP